MFTSEVICVLQVLHVMSAAAIMEDPGELLLLQVEKIPLLYAKTDPLFKDMKKNDIRYRTYVKITSSSSLSAIMHATVPAISESAYTQVCYK